MNNDIKSFMDEREMLKVNFDEVHYIDFYRDIFPCGSFQINADEMDSKGNGLAVEDGRAHV